MTKPDIPKTLQERLDALTPEAFERLEKFLGGLEDKSPEEIVRAIDLQTILAEDREVLNLLAQ